MLSATCHCGAVRIEIPHAPETVTNCNCSICRRYGALWAYYPADSVRITGHPGNTAEYIWGDRMLRFVRCSHCGCVTHWEAIEPAPDSRRGVNIRNFDPLALGSVRIRRLDGADTWAHLD
jgi:hypothetical protein